MVYLCAKKFGLPLSAAFESNVYSESGPVLSRLWRLRMFHLARHWDSMGRPELFPLASLEPFETPEDMAEHLNKGTSRVVKRRQIIEGIVPAAVLCEKEKGSDTL
eukprot:4005514-Amphidinium_carterae.1